MEDLRNQQFLTFSRNDALNFSVWLQVWNVDFFMAILWSGYQKEHLDYAMLLRLSQEDGTLPQGLLTVFFPGMFRGRVLSGLHFAYEAHLYCRSTFRHEGRAFCQRLGVELGRFLIDPPMDLILSLFTSVFLRLLGILLFRGFRLLECCRYLLVMFLGLVTARDIHLLTFRFHQDLHFTSS